MNDRIRELEQELAFYRALFADCCALDTARQALDALDSHEGPHADQVWDAFNEALDDVCEYVRCGEHADAMDAAGVTCNELHHASVVLSA